MYDEKFEIIFDKLERNYEDIDGLMKRVSNELEYNPDNKALQDILLELIGIAKNYTNMQMDYTDTYCPSNADNLLNQLYYRRQELDSTTKMKKGAVQKLNN